MRSLRRGSAAGRMVGLWVRIPGAWMSDFVSVVRCLLQMSGLGWSLVQRSHTNCGLSNEFDREAPLGEATTRNRAKEPQKIKNYLSRKIQLNLKILPNSHI
jgi:hypothetical protein